jgi:hypothetical protein
MYILQHPTLKMILVFSRVTEGVAEKAWKTGADYLLEPNL